MCKTFFWLYRSVGFEGNIMYAKKVLLKKNFSKYISPDISVIYLFANLRVFLVGLGNLCEFLSFFIEVSEEI